MPYRLGDTYHGSGFWTSGSILTNPIATTVLVDTGALSAGRYLFSVSAESDVAWIYDIQHRNAANGANVAAQRRRPAAGSEDFLFPNKITIAENERVRLLLVNGVTGEVQACIFYVEVL